MNEQKSGSRLGFMIPTLVLVLIFVVCCGVLAGIFARSAAVSARAEQYGTAVQQCRNAAEAFRAGTELPEETAYPGGVVAVQISGERRAAGNMLLAVITARTESGEELCTLNAARYVPDGR